MRITPRDDTLEILGAVVAFWRFLFDGGYRRRGLTAFRDAEWLDRAFMIMYAVIAIMSGLIALALLLWIAATIF